MSKIIGNFTQTYQGTPQWSPGSDCKNRDFLINAFCNNKEKIEIYNLLDYPSFNFHNFVDINHAKTLALKLKNIIPKINCVCYNNMSMGQCIYKHLTTLKSLGITDFLWVQDDEFFTNNNLEDFKKVLDFYKKTPEIKNLSLLYSLSDTVGLLPQNEQNVPQTNLTLYKYTTTDILPHRRYAMDFTAFVCSIDYFLENMFDRRFETILDAYQLEGAVLQKSVATNSQRCFLNTKFFESFNIVGMGGSLGDSKNASKKLKLLFGTEIP